MTSKKLIRLFATSFIALITILVLHFEVGFLTDDSALIVGLALSMTSLAALIATISKRLDEKDL